MYEPKAATTSERKPPRGHSSEDTCQPNLQLLRLRPWARFATIANEILHAGFFGVATVNGLLPARPIFVFTRLLAFPLT
jgi:hypothetical protein